MQALSAREQSTSAAQATQLGLGSCEQTPPEQVSVVQASLSLGQSASVVQGSQPPSVALAWRSNALVACTDAVLRKSPALQSGVASAVISTVRRRPAARVGDVTRSGFVDSTV